MLGFNTKFYYFNSIHIISYVIFAKSIYRNY